MEELEEEEELGRRYCVVHERFRINFKLALT